LDNQGNLKVSDFGHAGIFIQGWDYFSTTAVGSLYHLSPEQVLGRAYSGEKIDTWAIGVALYRMLTGYPPFMGSVQDICQNVQNVKYTIPDIINERAADLIKKLIVKEPEERISLTDVLEHPWTCGIQGLPRLFLLMKFQ